MHETTFEKDDYDDIGKYNSTASAEFVLQQIKALSKAPRPAGTDSDIKSTQFVRAELERNSGFTIEVNRFEFKRYVPKDYSLNIQGEEVECRPCLCSTNTPKRGVEGQIAALDGAPSLEGKIALIQIGSTHESLEIERAAKRGAIGAIVFQDGTPLLAGRAKYPSSSIPAVSIDGTVGRKLSNNFLLQGKEVEGGGGRRRTINANFKVRSLRSNAVGINVFSSPKKNYNSRKTTTNLFVAHRDSREFSNGAIDNGSGTSLLLYLSRIESSPSLLLSTDAEEYGLLGAQRFLKSQGKDMKKFNTAVVNLDSIGTGRLHLILRSRSGLLSRRLNDKIRSLARSKVRLKLRSLTTPRGSDSDIFQSEGFDSAWIRSYPTPSATTIEDTSDKISLEELKRACRLVSALDTADFSL